MSNFKIKKEESKIVGTATFDSASDYKVIVMDGENFIEHKILADKLIAKGVAKLAKDQNIVMTEPPMTVTVIEK